jgi:tetratricopeptide (TPR) repeat protein
MKKLFTFTFVALLALGSVSCAKLQARDNLIKGQQAFKNAKYEVAIDYFKKSMELDPNLTVAELYLATAYSQQFIPGAQSAANQQMADKAVETFENILKKEPNNVNAIAGLAFIYQNTLQLHKAHEYYVKETQLEPSNPVPFYAVASIDWIIVHDKNDPPPVDEQNHLVDEGIAAADKAIALNPDYDEAMSYRNLLLREKARLAETEEAKAKLVADADTWFEKAIETRKKNQEKKNKIQQGIVMEKKK